MIPIYDAQLIEFARRLHFVMETHAHLSGLLTREHQRYLTTIIDALNEPGWITEEGICKASLTAHEQPDHSVDEEYIGARVFNEETAQPYVMIPMHERLKVGDRHHPLPPEDGNPPREDTILTTTSNDVIRPTYVVVVGTWFRPV